MRNTAGVGNIISSVIEGRKQGEGIGDRGKIEKTD